MCLIGDRLTCFVQAVV